MNHGWIAVRCRYDEWEWRGLVPKRKEKESYSISTEISSLRRLSVKWRRFLVISGKANLKLLCDFRNHDHLNCTRTPPNHEKVSNSSKRVIIQYPRQHASSYNEAFQSRKRLCTCARATRACPRPTWHSGNYPAGSTSNLLDPNPDLSSTEKQSL